MFKNKRLTEIDKLDWHGAKKEGLDDMYECLLEINATGNKSGVLNELAGGWQSGTSQGYGNKRLLICIRLIRCTFIVKA